ncbi:MAG: hypothetical protein MJ052_04100 [Sphaerochaetaceae bacterium]|nr:hypothetical protein [Sphaerochaetaceae bacterium]
MIVCIGDRHYALDMALRLSKKDAAVSFLGPLTSSDDDLKILENLIDNCVMFDPIFCNSGDAESKVDRKRLESAFSSNCDINAVYISPAVVSDSFQLSETEKALKTVDARVFAGSPDDNPDVIADALIDADNEKKR